MSIARLGDRIEGMTENEHSEHYTNPHGPLKITGTISGGCSDSVFIGGVPVALEGSITEEHDDCCGTSYGKVGTTNATIFAKGIPVALVGSPIIAHNGTAKIVSGSDIVMGK